MSITVQYDEISWYDNSLILKTLPSNDKSISTNILNVMIRSDPTTAQLPLLPSPPMSLRLDWRDSGCLRYLFMLNIYWFRLLNLFNVLSKVHLWSYPSSKVLRIGSICLYRSLSQLIMSSYLQSHCKCGRFCSWTDGALYFFNAQMFTKSILHSLYIVLYGKCLLLTSQLSAW